LKEVDSNLIGPGSQLTIRGSELTFYATAHCAMVLRMDEHRQVLVELVEPDGGTAVKAFVLSLMELSVFGLVAPPHRLEDFFWEDPSHERRPPDTAEESGDGSRDRDLLMLGIIVGTATAGIADGVPVEIRKLHASELSAGAQSDLGC
jgi:hypothetical protein